MPSRAEGRFLAAMTAACLAVSALAVALADHGWVEFETTGQSGLERVAEAPAANDGTIALPTAPAIKEIDRPANGPVAQPAAFVPASAGANEVSESGAPR